jgi:hypothetical protein
MDSASAARLFCTGRRAGPPSDGDCGAAYNAFIAEPNTLASGDPFEALRRQCHACPSRNSVDMGARRQDFSPPRLKFAKLPVHYAAGAGDESADISTPVREYIPPGRLGRTPSPRRKLGMLRLQKAIKMAQKWLSRDRASSWLFGHYSGYRTKDG